MARKTPQTIIVIPPDGAGDARTEVLPMDSNNRLAKMQELVGGYIEMVMACRWNDRSLEVYVNEDGIAKQLTPNARATRLVDRTRTMLQAVGIQGPMIVTKISGRNITELAAEQMLAWLNKPQED